MQAADLAQSATYRPTLTCQQQHCCSYSSSLRTVCLRVARLVLVGPASSSARYMASDRWICVIADCCDVCFAVAVFLLAGCSAAGTVAARECGVVC